MPKHNAAARLVKLLDTIRGRGGGGATYEQWAEIFEIDPSQNIQTMLAVMERMIWMCAEVKSVQVGMVGRVSSDDLYAVTLSRVLNLLSPQLMAADVRQLREGITQDMMTTLGFCAELLPDEEDAINPEDLTAIRNLATELEALLERGAIPPTLLSMLRHHLTLIYAALDRYPVTGASALREAMYTAVGEIYIRREEMAANRDEPSVKKTLSLWAKVGKVTDGVIKIDKLFQLANKAGEFFQALSSHSGG
jgi:hypothetical protein